MRSGLVPICLLIGLLLTGCGDEDSRPTGPGGGGDDYTLQTSTTIGSGGGTLSMDDFSLTVPAGAFDSDADLDLYASSQDDPFGDAAVSDVFRIEGIPEDFSLSLQLSLRYEATLSGNSYVAVGEEVTIPYTGDSDIDYTLIPAADSLGFLHCEIPVPAAKGEHDLRRNLSVVGTTHYSTYYTGDGKFRIEYPHYLVTHVGDLETCLSQAIVLYVSMGFDPTKITIPISVLVRKPEAEKADLYYNGERIVVNELRMSGEGLAEICWMAVAEVFDRFYEIYTTFSFAGDSDPPLHNGWLYYATKMALEDHYAGEEMGLAEALLTDSEYYPFVGFQAGVTSSVPQTGFHGYGMGPVIRHLWLREKDDDFIGRMYTAIEDDNPTHHIAGLLSGAGDDTDEWVPEFFKEYLLGEIYPLDTQKILTHAHLWEIDESTDTSEVYAVDVADLSARVVQIVPSESAVDSTTSLQLTAGGEVNPDYLWILVFSRDRVKNAKQDGGALEFLVEGADLTVENLKWFAQQNKEIIAVIVNSAYEEPGYSSAWSVNLTMRATTKIDLSIFDTAALWIRYEAAWNDGPVSNQMLTFMNRGGSFTGYTYSASWDSLDGGVRKYGQFNVTLASDSKVESWYAENHWSWDNNLYTYRCYGGGAGGVERVTRTDSHIEFGIYDQTACNPITEIYVQKIVEGVEETVLLDFDCSGSSYIEFDFWDEEP